MSEGEFSVWQFFTGGSCQREPERYTRVAAVRQATVLTKTLAAQTGSTCRIIITNGGDHTVWEWRHGEGVVFPTPEDCQR